MLAPVVAAIADGQADTEQIVDGHILKHHKRSSR